MTNAPNRIWASPSYGQDWSMRVDAGARAFKVDIEYIRLDPAAMREAGYAPAAQAVSVKALEWEGADTDLAIAKAPLFGTIRIEHTWRGKYIVVWSVPGYCDTYAVGKFDTMEAAMDAAQSKYTTAILSATTTQSAAPDIDAPENMYSGAMVDAAFTEIDRLRAFVEEVRDCKPEVHSGQAPDPKDTVDDMIAAEWFTDLQADAVEALKKPTVSTTQSAAEVRNAVLREAVKLLLNLISDEKSEPANHGTYPQLNERVVNKVIALMTKEADG